MKVLLYGPYSNDNNKSIGGPAKVIRNIANYCKSRNGIEILIVSTGFKSIFYYLKSFFSIILWRPDVVHIHIPNKGAIFLLLYCKLLRVPIIYTIHGLIRMSRRFGTNASLYAEITEYILFHYVDKITSVSKQAVEMVKKLYKLSLLEVIIIPNGVEDFFLNYRSYSSIADQILSNKNNSVIDKNKFIIFSAIGGKKLKGLKFYLQAISILGDKYEFLLAGQKGNDWELIKNAEKEGLIKYIGNLDQYELRKFYNISTIYVQPSECETFGIAPLEAMACGTPVIVSDKVGMKYLLNSIEHTVVHYGDYRQLAENIEYLLNDAAHLKYQGSLVRKIAKSYSWSKISQLYINLWNNIIKNKKSI